MTRFANNPTLAANAVRQPDTINTAGGLAYENTPKTALALMLINSFASGDHYQSAEQQLGHIQNLARAVGDWRWVARAAIYARDALGMRTTSHFVTAVIASNARGESWLRPFYNRVVVRPDDMCEAIAAYMMLNGKDAPIPNAMKRGFADRFKRLDEYQLAKYAGGGRAVKLVDVMRLCHAGGDADTPIGKLARGTLQPPKTWEVELSAAGSDPEKRAQVWRGLLDNRKLGYLACLRNLRNIAKDAPTHLPKALELLSSVDHLRRARVYPFQLFTAISLFGGLSGWRSGWGDVKTNDIPERQRQTVVDVLSNALDESVKIVPQLDGPTMVAIDSSASMDTRLNPKSSVTAFQVGLLMGACCVKQQAEGEVCLWADRAEQYRYGPRNQPVVTIANQLAAHLGEVGCGTNVSSVLNVMRPDHRRLLIFSDMQSWHGDYQGLSRWVQRDRRHWLYAWNVVGNATSLVDPHLPRQHQFGGFSDKVWDTIPMTEAGADGLVAAIDAHQVEGL